MENSDIKYNYHNLKREIVYKYGSLKIFAVNVLKITPVYFSRILASKAEYSQRLITITINALNLNPNLVGLYFFTQELRKYTNYD